MRTLLNWGVIPTRMVLGAIFFTAGMAKVWPEHRFPGLIGPVWLIEELETYRLGLYATFIAWSQIGIGLLLLTQRFARLAAVMLVPMLLNILFVTISQQWKGTPYIIAALLFLNLYLLLMDFPVLKWVLSDQKSTHATPIRSNLKKDSYHIVGLLLVLASPLIAQQWLMPAIVILSVGLLALTVNQFYPRP